MTIASVAQANGVMEVIWEGLAALLRLLKRALRRCPIVRLMRRISRRIAPLKRRLIVLSWALTIRLVARLSPLAARGYPASELARTYGHFHIVGLKYYLGAVSPGDIVSLVRKPDNKYDSNAIAVYNRSGDQVGFISREEARMLAPIMDRGARLRGRVLRKVNPYRIRIEVAED